MNSQLTTVLIANSAFLHPHFDVVLNKIYCWM